MRTMLSVKVVCVVTVPVRGEIWTGTGGNAAANGLTVLTDPRSTKRYSSFHLQRGDSPPENMPSTPAPIVYPACVRDTSNAVRVGAKDMAATAIEPLTAVGRASCRER